MSFAYLFERFPSFVQTFVYREAVEMMRQGMAPWLVSIRRPEDPAELSEEMDVEVFYPPEEKALRAEVDAAREAGKLSWTANRAMARHRKTHDSQRMFEAIWLARHLRARGIRHVHAHFGGLASRTAWWLRKLFGFRYSFTGHANDIFCETDFPTSNGDLVRGAKFIVTETDYAREWMEEKYPSACGKIFRVFNGIGLDGFPPRALKGGVPKILSVGRSVEKKGFADLIEACRLLHTRLQERASHQSHPHTPNLAFACDIIGGGPLDQTLQAQIDRQDLGAVVRLLGPMPQSEVRLRLAEADIFVLASVPDAGGGSDNLPTVIMEAMACGTPVTSTRLAGIPEMIRDGVDGLLVSPQNPPALADAIESLLRNPVRAEALGKQGRLAAEEKFSIANTTRALKFLLVKHGVPPPDVARQADPRLPSLHVFDRIRQICRL